MPHSTRSSAGEQVFMCLFQAYKSRLFGFVFTITHSRFIAEEITQEVFLKLWLKRAELDQIENKEAYLFAIARNKTLNYLRKASYHEKRLTETRAMIPDPVNDIEQRQNASECNGMLEKAITQLPPKRRQVYRLSRNLGLNHNEIARQLHISPNTVKNHLVQTLRFIRNYLRRNGIGMLCLLAVKFFN